MGSGIWEGGWKEAKRRGCAVEGMELWRAKVGEGLERRGREGSVWKCYGGAVGEEKRQGELWMEGGIGAMDVGASKGLSWEGGCRDMAGGFREDV